MRILVDATHYNTLATRQRLIDRARQAAIAAECSGCDTLAAHYSQLATQGEAVFAHELSILQANGNAEVQ